MEVSNREEESIPREIPITVYSAEITNGYVFRQIFELYNKLVMEGIPIYFKESGITIRTGTSSSRDSMKLISDIEIYTDDIIEYYMNKELATIKASDEDTACYIEELNINTVKSAARISSHNCSFPLKFLGHKRWLEWRIVRFIIFKRFALRLAHPASKLLAVSSEPGQQPPADAGRQTALLLADLPSPLILETTPTPGKGCWRYHLHAQMRPSLNFQAL